MRITSKRHSVNWTNLMKSETLTLTRTKSQKTAERCKKYYAPNASKLRKSWRNRSRVSKMLQRVLNSVKPVWRPSVIYSASTRKSRWNRNWLNSIKKLKLRIVFTTSWRSWIRRKSCLQSRRRLNADVKSWKESRLKSTRMRWNKNKNNTNEKWMN